MISRGILIGVLYFMNLIRLGLLLRMIRNRSIWMQILNKSSIYSKESINSSIEFQTSKY